MKNGYTLTELLIITIVVAVLLSLAIPAYQNLAARNRAIAQVNQLMTAINFARSEAIKRRSVVTLCKSNNGQSCQGEWRDGWLVFVDKKAEGRINPDDLILRVYSALPAGDRLDWQAGLHKNNYLQFTANGNTRGQAGSFIYSAPEQVYKIIISLNGRARLEKSG